MKLRKFFVMAAVALGAIVACEEKEEDLGLPKISISPKELTFDAAAAEPQKITLISTRDWQIEEFAEDWIAVDPSEGKASSEGWEITITLDENSGMDREVKIKFTIGLSSSTLTVKQAGPGGTTEPIYVNDFDKEVATKTFGSKGSSWPYLDQFAGWQNQTGTGAANVEYAFSGMSARANAESNGQYSDYVNQASGSNNMFFGSNAYFAVKNIALGGTTDLVMTFGTEKSTYNDDANSIFLSSEYHIYLSNDGVKWVEFTGYTFAGGETPARWNLATANISVPANTANLSVCMKVDVASVYRMDDLTILPAAAAGTAVDFTNAVEMDFNAGGSTGGGNTGGGSFTPPADSEITSLTVAQFNEKEVGEAWYRLVGTVGGPINAQYGNFDLTDATGKVYVYGIENWSEYKDQVAVGGTVTVVGKRGDYNGKIEVLDGYIEKYDSSTEKEEEVLDPIESTIANFLAAEEGSQPYKLTGVISNVVNTTYGNFDLTDETGTVYVYGLTAKKVSSNDKSYSSLGLKAGDTVTLIGTRASYNDTPQVGGPAYYVSHVAGEGGDEDDDQTTTLESISCSMIDKVADLVAGTYLMATYAEAGDSKTVDFSANPYHLYTGVVATGNGDCYTTPYSYANGTLTPRAGETYAAVEVTLEAVSGKNDTYKIKVTDGYIYSTAAENRKLAVGETAAEWEAVANENGGITFKTSVKGTYVHMGAAKADTKLIRSYKNESTLKHGLIFFKKN